MRNGTNDLIVLPTVAGSDASGACIGAAGITAGNVRGRKHSPGGGTVVRPDFALLDDPQTRDSARSPGQTRQREQLIKSDVGGMGGRNKRIGMLRALMTAVDPETWRSGCWTAS